MAVLLKNGLYKCLFCNFTDKNALPVDFHQMKEHDYVLLPITVDELFRLTQFIINKDPRLISPELYKRLKLYLNNFNKKQKRETAE